MLQMFIIVLQKPPRNWGKIVDSSTGNSLKGAFISILDTVEQRQIDMQLSDAQGRFGMILEKQSYLLKINLSGFKIKKINKDWQTVLLPGGDVAYMLPINGVENLDIEMESLSIS
jgi:hypothetical protein